MTTSATQRTPQPRPLALRPTSWPLWLTVVVVYLGLRLVSAVLLARAATDQVWFPGVTGPAEGDVDLAMSWDAQWYQRIAEEGYPDALPVDETGRVQQNPWAFYPVFPLAVRTVTSLTGLGFPTVAPLLALLAGLGAAVLMARVLTDTGIGRGPAVAAVAVWAACPVAPVLQLAYTESFAMLLLLAFLLLLVREQWWPAAGVALLLGLTRPVALPLAVVVAVAVLMRWRARHERPIGAREAVGLGAAVVGTGVSGVLWAAVAAVGAGRPDAYPATMTAWRGEAAITPWEPWQRTIAWALETHDRVFVLPALGIVVPTALSLALLIPRFAPAVDLRLRVWAAAYSLYLVAVVDGHTSIFRYLVFLFPLAIVLVGAHRRDGEGSPWWRLRAAWWVAVGVAGQVGWIWWLLVFTPPSDFPP